MTNSPKTPLPLASLRLAPRDAADLRWLLLRDYEGDLGVRSPLGLQLDAARAALPRSPSPHPHAVYVPDTHDRRRIVDLSDEVLAAARRLRALERRWAALELPHRSTLRSLYGETRPSLPEWGDVGPLVLDSPVARTAHEHSGDKRPLDAWLARIVTRPAKSLLVAQLRTRAEVRLVAACRAWERTRKAAS